MHTYFIWDMWVSPLQYLSGRAMRTEGIIEQKQHRKRGSVGTRVKLTTQIRSYTSIVRVGVVVVGMCMWVCVRATHTQSCTKNQQNQKKRLNEKWKVWVWYSLEWVMARNRERRDESRRARGESSSTHTDCCFCCCGHKYQNKKPVSAFRTWKMYRKKWESRVKNRRRRLRGEGDYANATTVENQTKQQHQQKIWMGKHRQSTTITTTATTHSGSMKMKQNKIEKKDFVWQWL